MLAAPGSMPIKAVARRIPPDSVDADRISWVEAGLLDQSALERVLGPGDVVVNLAFMANSDEAENRRLLDNVINACLARRVQKIVHCSTAVVVGASPEVRVVETTACAPRTRYERIKWELEQQLLTAVSRGVDVGIVRPTAVVGPGGQNLLKLARSLRNGNAAANYLRACVFGRRPMHLVPVADVAAALLHLADPSKLLNGNIYIVSSKEEDQQNTYLAVETILADVLHVTRWSLPVLTIPLPMLSVLLRLCGRADASINRVYDSGKLGAAGFRSVQSVSDAVREFGRVFSAT